MTLAELLADARMKSTDDVVPYLWSDAELKGYANEAEREACRRGRLIVDSTSPAVCNITLVANRPTYLLSPLVLFVRRVKLTAETLPLRPVSFMDLDVARPGWEDETGTPTHFVKDSDTGKLRPYPMPTVATPARLTVVRMPLSDMTEDTDEPELRPHLHESLVHWMLYRMYSKPDADTQDKTKAAEHLALFEQEFGKKSSAFDEAWIEREHGYTPDEGVY